MWKSLIHSSVLLALGASSVCSLHATGDFGPRNWLLHGGEAVNHPPEFYWADEVTRIAREFHPKEKRVSSDAKPAAEGADAPADSYVKEVEEKDKADYADALKTGRIKGDAQTAAKLHDEARTLINGIDDSGTSPVPALPAEPASEFADYHKGAHAFKQGQKHWDEARAAWEALMQRPKEERHYRSTWAAFMIGKVALFQKKPDAVKWFQLVRKLATDGFADSLGLAADSYGWEAKAELDAGNFEKSARLYLTQLALGDTSAIISLKAVIPDRMSVWGMMNFDGAGPDAPQPEVTPELIKKHREALVRSARDDILRRLQTVHVLATETVTDTWRWGGTSDGPQKEDRLGNWLAALEKAGIKQTADADRLAWCAYTQGSYKSAASWLKLCEKDSSMSLWLRVKLLRRDGKLKEAEELMAKVPALLEEESLRPSKEAEEYEWAEGRSLWSAAHGELASLYLSNNRFIDAMNVFFSGGHREDALFIAERVLTTDELLTFANSLKEDDPRHVVKQVLAPRLVREDRYDEARKWFYEEQQKNLDEYVALLKQGEDEKRSKKERAKALFDSAMLLEANGGLMNPMFQPDAPRTDGSNPKKPKPQSLPQDRAAGFYWLTRFTDTAAEKYEKRPLSVPASALEKKRLAASKPAPDRYNPALFVAAALAKKAAALLPDNTDELADVLNTAGNWVKGDYYGDDDEADKFFQLIERRASKTDLGKAANKKHWFVDQKGPWSQ